MKLAAEIPRLRGDLERARGALHRAFRRNRDPGPVLAGMTGAVDGIVQALFAQYLPEEGHTLLAIGGYGRSQLFPASDIDLLLLHDDGETADTEQGTASLLRDLWDLGLRTGQQVWSRRQLRKLDAEDFEFATALLSSRPVAGDGALAGWLQDEFLPDFLRRRRLSLKEKIVEATRRRHADFRDTIYQLEPDVKLSPGCLRDFLAARWLSRIEGVEVFVPYTADQLRQAHDFMARLRVWLHFHNGRDRNVLQHPLQEKAADELGFGGGSTRSAVESLMKEYYLHARAIEALCRRTLRAVSPRIDEEIGSEDVGPLGDMADLIEVFLKSARQDRVLSDAAENRIMEALPTVSANLSYPNLQSKTRELFQPAPGLYAALGEMVQLGVMEILFPEFETISARVIRDFYHRYTVDEHSLQAIQAVCELADPASDADPRFRALMEETATPEILTLALLLHDVGKSRGGKHVDTGARMAAKALKRLRFEKSAADTIVFLIRHHLAMSAVSHRRNLEDDEEIGRFADLVQNTTRLRLLCLLTYADMKAVAPGTLNDWRKERLWQLYVAAYNKLTIRFGEARIEEEDIGDRLWSGLPHDLDPERFDEFLEGFPRRYLTATPPAEIYQHCRLGQKLTPEDPVQTRLTDRKTHFELCVVTRDRRYLFSKIAGLLTYFDGNILRGYGFSNRQGVVLDIFEFSDTRDVFRLNPEEKRRFEKLLLQVVEGGVSVEDLLARKEASPVFQTGPARFEPTVYFVEGAEKDYSIVEIVAPDSIGLLYRISREISRLECNIELALISTEGEKAVDVFYLTLGGGKLDVPARTELVRRITEAIGAKS